VLIADCVRVIGNGGREGRGLGNCVLTADCVRGNGKRGKEREGSGGIVC